MFGFVRGRAVVVVLVVAGLLAGVTAGSVTAATSTTVTWKVSSLTAGQVKNLSDVATSNSRGVKTWSKSGSCTLTPKSEPTKLTMGTGTCTLKLKIAKSGKYLAKTSSKTITRKLPAVRTNLSKAKVLKTSSVRLAKVVGIAGSGVQAANVRPTQIGDVIFRTSGIVAYAQAETTNPSGSNLLAVSATGATSDAISSGSAVVKDIYSARNGDVYIVFEQKVALTTGGTPCLLAVIDVSTGVPTCIDTTLDSISSDLGYSDSIGNSPIQTDASGAVYYAGSAGSSTVLRKAKNGVITDFLSTGNIYLKDFVVLSDGTIIISGSTNSTNVSWLRRISPTGSLKNLVVGRVYSLQKFADGNIYVGLYAEEHFGVTRYSVDLDALEEKYWIARCCQDSYFRVEELSDCQDTATANSAICSLSGAMMRSVFNVLGQKTFVVVGGSGDKQVWQYYPTVKKANVTTIENVTLAQQVLTIIILAGTSSSGSNTLSLYDTSSQQETVVMNGTKEIEIYSMSYSLRSNSILFTGLRFSDNKYVVGEVSLG